MKKLLLLILAVISLKVGAQTINPTSTRFSNGVLIPSKPTGSPPSITQFGALWGDSTVHRFKWHDGTTWQQVPLASELTALSRTLQQVTTAGNTSTNGIILTGLGGVTFAGSGMTGYYNTGTSTAQWAFHVAGAVKSAITFQSQTSVNAGVTLNTSRLQIGKGFNSGDAVNKGQIDSMSTVLTNLLGLKAPVANPTFTGTVAISTAPSSPAGTYNVLGYSTQAGTAGNLVTLPAPTSQTLSLGSASGNIAISGGNNVTLTSLGLGSGYTGDANASALYATAGFYPYFNGSGSTNYPTTGGAGFRIVPVGGTTGRLPEMWVNSTSDSTIYMRKGIGSGNYSSWMPLVTAGVARVYGKMIISPTGNTYQQDGGPSETGPGLYLSRTFSTGSTNEHGFMDRTTFGRTSVAYNSFDAQAILTGTTMDHYDSFQARPNIQNVIDEIRGHSFIPRLNVSGSVTNMFAFKVYAPTGTAAANVTNNYGLWVQSMGSGTAKKLAINIEADSSHFGGIVNGFAGFDSRNGTGYFVDGKGALSYDASTSLGINKTSSLRDIKFYSGADGGTPKLTLANTGTIVSRPAIASDNLKLEYDGSNSTGFKTSATGNLTITPTGGQTNITGSLAAGDVYISNVPPTSVSGYTFMTRDNTTGQIGKVSSTGLGASDLAVGTVTATDVPITNSNGTGFTLPSATGSLAGLLSATSQDIGGVKNFTNPLFITSATFPQFIVRSSTTDAARKLGYFGVSHYTNAEEPMGLIVGDANSTTNTLSIGGGSSFFNAATSIDLYTAANSTTATGTSRLSINSAGLVNIPGNSTIGGTLGVTGAITGALTGNASTATALQTSRTIWGQAFTGAANVTGAMSGVTTLAMGGALTGATTGAFSSTLSATALYNVTTSNNAALSMNASGTVASRNVADANPAFLVNSIAGTGAIATFQQASVTVANITSVGTFFGNGIANTATGNNSQVITGSTGTVISRNIADANDVLTVNNVNASSTGLNLDLQNAGATTASVSKTGVGTFSALNVSTAPTTSAGTYDILTRNTSTGVVEKIPSTSLPIAGSFSGVGTATTTFTVTIGQTMANTTYKVPQPGARNVLSAALCYITNKTTTTFDVVFMAGLTGTVAFDWVVVP